MPKPSHIPSQHKSTQRRPIPKYGKSAQCKPIGFPQVTTCETVKWAWFPEWSNLALLATALSVFFTVGFLFLFLGAGLGAGGLSALGGILMILTCPILSCVLPNWMWNARKQAAHSNARFKSIEAKSLWRNVDPQFHYQAKDLFFETGYGGKRLKVLRDGTIEVHGAHNEFGGEDGGGDGGGEGDGGDFDTKEVTMTYLEGA